MDAPAPPDDAAPADLVGATLLGKLRVIRRLGEGASGTVYEVLHLLTKHRRALKVLHGELASSGEAVARLVREAGAAGRIQSPFVAETYDVGRLPSGAPYVLSELLDGEPLRAELDRRGRLPPAEAARLGASLAAGLAAVHAAGVIHRDIKPENLFLVRGEGGTRALKIVDFGVMLPSGGRDTLGQLTRPGARAGTPLYMAPEQLDGGAVDARADVWAAGVVLFEAITGRRPFEAAGAEALLAALAAGDHPPLSALAPEVPPALEAAVHRAIEPDRERRFASAEALREALEPLAAADLGPLAPWPPGSALADRYEVVRVIKSGGMGAVYEVVHRETQRRRALKLMLPGALASEELRARFRLEARAAAAIDAEHVVDVVDAGVDATTGAPYLVMELLEGEDLAGLLERRARLSPAEAQGILAPIAEALDKLHRAGVVHRDLKPQNVFLARRADGAARVKILDFGIAKLIGEGTSGDAVTQGALGTPLYMAPEQLDAGGSVGPATDRAALAHLAFTLLVGSPYFAEEARAGTMPLLARVGRGPEEPASVRAARLGAALPRAFDAWFARAAALDPGARFPSATEQIEALAAALEGGPETTLAAVARPASASVGRSRVAFAAAVALGLTSIGALAMGWKPRAPEPAAARPAASSAFLEAPIAAVEPPQRASAAPASSAPEPSASAAPAPSAARPPSRPPVRPPPAASAAPAAPTPPVHDSVF